MYFRLKLPIKMKKTPIRLFVAIMMIISLCASIHLNTVSNQMTPPQAELIKKITDEAPAESILPEVQVVKTILQKFIDIL